MEARVKISHFTHKQKTVGDNFVRKSFATNILGSEAVSQHNIALFLLDDEIRFNDRQNIVQHWASSLPVINRSGELLFTGPSISRIFRTAKSIFKPYYDFLVATSYFKHAMPLKAIAIFALFNIANIQATFSVNKACKISYLPNFVMCSEIYDFPHDYPLINNYTVINEKIHGERLSEKTRKGCDSLTSGRKPEREIRRGFPATQVVTKVTEMVLNECAARLGVSLRQTEDTLISTMLASTASFINCVGGVNGDNPTEITRSDVDTVVRALLNNNAYTVLDNIEGEDRFGTAPVRDAYFALCSTQLTGSGGLDSVTGFIQKTQYPSPMNSLRSEWGSIGNLRFLVSSIGSYTPNASNLGANVYNIFCTGIEAYAYIEQDGYSASFIYRPPIYDGPLALNASVGYKFAQVPRITNDLWVINLRATLAV